MILLVILFSASADAQFNKSDIDDLKAALSNYANSGCKDDSYRDSALKIMGPMVTKFDSSITPEQGKKNDQLRDAVSGALLAGMMDKPSCPAKIEDAIKKLNEMPVKTKTSKPDPKLLDGTGTTG